MSAADFVDAETDPNTIEDMAFAMFEVVCQETKGD